MTVGLLCQTQLVGLQAKFASFVIDSLDALEELLRLHYLAVMTAHQRGHLCGYLADFFCGGNSLAVFEHQADALQRLAATVKGKYGIIEVWSLLIADYCSYLLIVQVDCFL